MNKSITKSVRKTVRVKGLFAPNEYAKIHLPHDGPFIARKGETRLGNPWIYLYSGSSRVMDCNETYFQCHFRKVETK
jgi:hypothetical protein